MIVCHITPSEVTVSAPLRAGFAGEGRPMLPAAMKVLSRWTELIPMIAIEDRGIHVAEPLRLIGVVVEAQSGDEGLVSPDDDHHEEVRDHDHVDESEHDQHHGLFRQAGRFGDEVSEFLDEKHDIDSLRDDESQIEGELEPARAEDEGGKEAETGWRIVGRCRHGAWGGSQGGPGRDGGSREGQWDVMARSGFFNCRSMKILPQGTGVRSSQLLSGGG